MSRSVRASVVPPCERKEACQYASNKVLTAFPSLLIFIPISIIRQYTRPLSLYFLVIAGLLFIREISPYDPWSQIIPVLLVLSISVFRETMQELTRQQEDRRINSQRTRVNRNGAWIEVKWEDICVGDLVMVASDTPSPADIVMVASSTSGNTAYIQTTNLDGETNYKPRSGIDKAVMAVDMMASGKEVGDQKPEIVIHAEAPRSDLDWFEGQAVFRFVDKSEKTESPGSSAGTVSPQSGEPTLERLSIRNFIPREAVVRGTEWVIGVVIYTGFDTKVLLGNERPAYKTSKIDRMTDRLVFLILFLQFSLSIFVGLAGGISGSAVPRWWLDIALRGKLARGFIDGIACLILITQMIPISLIISLEIAKVYQAKLMEHDVQMPGMRAASQALNDDLGQIGYVLSDKTGTLTSNELVLKVATVAGKPYPDLTSLRSAAKTNPNVAALIDALSICHDVSPNWSSANTLSSSGDARKSILNMKQDAKKYKSKMEAESSGQITPLDEGGRLPIGMSYCGASPDEICFVTACAASLGRVLNKRTHAEMTFTDSEKGELRRKILRVFEFDNARRRSSIVIQIDDRTVAIYTKGSDDGMLPRCRAETDEEKQILKETETSLSFYSKQSLRTLVFAQKIISLAEWEKLLQKHTDQAALIDEVESGLSLIACTGTEDRLQDGVQGSIQRMRTAGVAVWMITGDKLDTAIEISKSANLIGVGMALTIIDLDSDELAVQKVEDLEAALSRPADSKVAAVITGKSIRYYAQSPSRFINALLKCKSVVVCRSTKDQKAQMVEMVQNAVQRNVLVLAIGDGANDVPMIKRADVGVGIAGKEGRQAAQNADYVITQFSHLDRLLLFHGRLNYVRTSKMVLYFIFKNLVLCLPFVIHSTIVAMYSSSALITSSMGLSFNTFLTALPVFAIGLVERDVSPNDHLVGFNGIKAHELAQAYPYVDIIIFLNHIFFLRKLYVTGRDNHMFGRFLLGSLFVASVLTGCWIYLCSVGPLVTSAISWSGFVADHWAVSDVYFFSVFCVDTAAVLLVSEGVTWPMAMTVVYSFLGALSFLVSNAYDASNPGGMALFELLTKSALLIPILVIAIFPPILLGIAAKNWKYRFDPTARMIWQEAKERADRRRAVLREMESSPSGSSRISDQHKSILSVGASVFYRPEEADMEFVAPLVTRSTN